MASGEEAFGYGLIITALVLMVGMPFVINLIVPDQPINEYQQVIDELNNDYMDFTGSKPVKEDVWILKGIYTPYENGGPSGYTPDGWLYGREIIDYQPSQYSGGPTAYSVSNRETVDGIVNQLGYYKYTSVGSAYAGIEAGSVYTSVAMSEDQKSDIFFTPQNKHDAGYGRFYFDYSGYRYSFSPIQNIRGVDDNGDIVEWSANSSSCSLIWYSYYNISSGISGQLVVRSGLDGGTAYITEENIIKNFTPSNNTAKIPLQFNGVSLNLYVRLDVYYLSSGYSIKECFDNGYWSVMLTSETADASGYVATDYSFNPTAIFETFIKLLTFNLDDYGFSPFVALFCSLMISLPLYAGLLIIALHNYKIVIIAGLFLLVQGFLTGASWLGGGGLFG